MDAGRCVVRGRPLHTGSGPAPRKPTTTMSSLAPVAFGDHGAKHNRILLMARTQLPSIPSSRCVFRRPYSIASCELFFVADWSQRKASREDLHISCIATMLESHHACRPDADCRQSSAKGVLRCAVIHISLGAFRSQLDVGCASSPRFGCTS